MAAAGSPRGSRPGSARDRRPGLPSGGVAYGDPQVLAGGTTQQVVSAGGGGPRPPPPRPALRPPPRTGGTPSVLPQRPSSARGGVRAAAAVPPRPSSARGAASRTATTTRGSPRKDRRAVVEFVEPEIGPDEVPEIVRARAFLEQRFGSLEVAFEQADFIPTHNLSHVELEFLFLSGEMRGCEIDRHGVTKIFEALDKDRNGTISRREFLGLKDPEMSKAREKSEPQEQTSQPRPGGSKEEPRRPRASSKSEGPHGGGAKERKEERRREEHHGVVAGEDGSQHHHHHLASEEAFDHHRQVQHHADNSQFRGVGGAPRQKQPGRPSRHHGGAHHPHHHQTSGFGSVWLERESRILAPELGEQDPKPPPLVKKTLTLHQQRLRSLMRRSSKDGFGAWCGAQTATHAGGRKMVRRREQEARARLAARVESARETRRNPKLNFMRQYWSIGYHNAFSDDREVAGLPATIRPPPRNLALVGFLLPSEAERLEREAKARERSCVDLDFLSNNECQAVVEEIRESDFWLARAEADGVDLCAVLPAPEEDEETRSPRGGLLNDLGLI